MKLKAVRALETQRLQAANDRACVHALRHTPGRYLLYNAAFEPVRVLDLSGWELPSRANMQVDPGSGRVCVWSGEGLRLLDFVGRELAALPGDILAAQVAPGGVLWAAVNHGPRQVECIRLDLHTGERASILLDDPMADLVPEGEHAVELYAVPGYPDAALLCCSDAQVSIKTYRIVRQGDLLAVAGALEDDFFPLALADDGSRMLARSFDDWDCVLRLHALPDLEPLGECVFPVEEAALSFEGVWYGNRVLMYEEEGAAYHCLDLDRMGFALLEIDWGGGPSPSPGDFRLLKSGDVLLAVLSGTGGAREYRLLDGV